MDSYNLQETTNSIEAATNIQSTQYDIAFTVWGSEIFLRTPNGMKLYYTLYVPPFLPSPTLKQSANAPLLV